MIELDNKDGEVLQSKVFHSCAKLFNNNTEYRYYYKNNEDDITLNEFLLENTNKIYKIFPVGSAHGQIIVLYYTLPKICKICGQIKCNCKDIKNGDENEIL